MGVAGGPSGHASGAEGTSAEAEGSARLLEAVESEAAEAGLATPMRPEAGGAWPSGGVGGGGAGGGAGGSGVVSASENGGEGEGEEGEGAIDYSVNEGFGELWEDRAERLRTASAHSSLPGWAVHAFIVKSHDELLQEQFAVSLIVEFEKIFKHARLVSAV